MLGLALEMRIRALSSLENQPARVPLYLHLSAPGNDRSSITAKEDYLRVFLLSAEPNIIIQYCMGILNTC